MVVALNLERRSGICVAPESNADAGKIPNTPSKASRQKESRFRWIRRLFAPRKSGILLFFIACLVLICHSSFSTVYVRHIIYLPRTDIILPTNIIDTELNTTPMMNPQSTQSESKSSTSGHHFCKNFSFPPPPPDNKRTGPRACPVCYVPVEQAMSLMPNLPSVSPIVNSLVYESEEKLIATESDGGSVFGGYSSLQQRKESFDIKNSMTVHCGFVRGKKPGQGTGFDIDDADLLEMEHCNGIVVVSAIFGNFDLLQQPKNITGTTKRSVCFYMFVDEETESYIRNSGNLESRKEAELWRRVIVRNLPYDDARRNGKVPKLLLHRLFPNARYSLWIDGKLQLVVDPYQIMERFLWREKSTFAISRHYKRFDVFKEAEANKAGNKYRNASIDSQIEFYKNEGLTPYSAAKLPITSDVPEGCVIVREHIPITNLFTCLWFNEVDRFTSRDQLSFSTVRDRIMSQVDWSVNMFNDCERRNFVNQSYHKDVLEMKRSAKSVTPPRPLQRSTDAPARRLVPGFTRKRNPTVRSRRDRKSGGSRHRQRDSA